MVPHTLVVDFVVALLITSVACDLLAAIAKDDEFRIVASWTLVFGSLAAVFAVLSGYAAFSAAAPTGAAERVVMTHRNLALATAGCFVPLAGWRLASGGHPPVKLAPLYWLLTLVGLGLLTLTAWYGGTAVFRHGVGVGLQG